MTSEEEKEKMLQDSDSDQSTIEYQPDTDQISPE
jgi:hypothetical protein